MTRMTKAEVTFNLAFIRTGNEAQLDKTVEESAELIHAIMKSRLFGAAYSHNVLTEMGHVELCIEMIKTKLVTLPSASGQGTLLDTYNYLKEKRLEEWYTFEVEQAEEATRRISEGGSG